MQSLNHAVFAFFTEGLALSRGFSPVDAHPILNINLTDSEHWRNHPFLASFGTGKEFTIDCCLVEHVECTIVGKVYGGSHTLTYLNSPSSCGSVKSLYQDNGTMNSKHQLMPRLIVPVGSPFIVCSKSCSYFLLSCSQISSFLSRVPLLIHFNILIMSANASYGAFWPSS